MVAVVVVLVDRCHHRRRVDDAGAQRPRAVDQPVVPRGATDGEGWKRAPEAARETEVVETSDRVEEAALRGERLEALLPARQVEVARLPQIQIPASANHHEGSAPGTRI